MKIDLALRRIITAVFLLTGSSSFAGDWNLLTGTSINDALNQRSIVYTTASSPSQTFHADGTTTYVEGRPSLGYWKVVSAQYCSQWPPSNSWVCYDVYINSVGDAIRFIGDSGEIWQGQYQ